jgi:hypothetical protein
MFNRPAKVFSQGVHQHLVCIAGFSYQNGVIAFNTGLQQVKDAAKSWEGFEKGNKPFFVPRSIIRLLADIFPDLFWHDDGSQLPDAIY